MNLFSKAIPCLLVASGAVGVAHASIYVQNNSSATWYLIPNFSSTEITLSKGANRESQGPAVQLEAGHTIITIDPGTTIRLVLGDAAAHQGTVSYNLHDTNFNNPELVTLTCQLLVGSVATPGDPGMGVRWGSSEDEEEGTLPGAFSSDRSTFTIIKNAYETPWDSLSHGMPMPLPELDANAAATAGLPLYGSPGRPFLGTSWTDSPLAQDSAAPSQPAAGAALGSPSNLSGGPGAAPASGLRQPGQPPNALRGPAAAGERHRVPRTLTFGPAALSEHPVAVVPAPGSPLASGSLPPSQPAARGARVPGFPAFHLAPSAAESAEASLERPAKRAKVPAPRGSGAGPEPSLEAPANNSLLTLANESLHPQFFILEHSNKTVTVIETPSFGQSRSSRVLKGHSRIFEFMPHSSLTLSAPQMEAAWSLDFALTPPRAQQLMAQDPIEPRRFHWQSLPSGEGPTQAAGSLVGKVQRFHSKGTMGDFRVHWDRSTLITLVPDSAEPENDLPKSDLYIINDTEQNQYLALTRAPQALRLQTLQPGLQPGPVKAVQAGMRANHVLLPRSVTNLRLMESGVPSDVAFAVTCSTALGVPEWHTYLRKSIPGAEGNGSLGVELFEVSPAGVPGPPVHASSSRHTGVLSLTITP